MIVGVGCDIVDYLTTENLEWTTDTVLQNTLFSKDELTLMNPQNTVKFLAGRFAVKEALLKAMGVGMQDGLSLLDIKVLQNSDGKPEIVLSGKIQEIADSLGITMWHVSISHSLNSSIGFVIAEKSQ